MSHSGLDLKGPPQPWGTQAFGDDLLPWGPASQWNCLFPMRVSISFGGDMQGKCSKTTFAYLWLSPRSPSLRSKWVNTVCPLERLPPTPSPATLWSWLGMWLENAHLQIDWSLSQDLRHLKPKEKEPNLSFPIILNSCWGRRELVFASTLEFILTCAAELPLSNGKSPWDCMCWYAETRMFHESLLQRKHSVCLILPHDASERCHNRGGTCVSLLVASWVLQRPFWITMAMLCQEPWRCL